MFKSKFIMFIVMFIMFDLVLPCFTSNSRPSHASTVCSQCSVFCPGSFGLAGVPWKQLIT